MASGSEFRNYANIERELRLERRRREKEENERKRQERIIRDMDAEIQRRERGESHCQTAGNECLDTRMTSDDTLTGSNQQREAKYQDRRLDTLQSRTREREDTSANRENEERRNTIDVVHGIRTPEDLFRDIVDRNHASDRVTDRLRYSDSDMNHYEERIRNREKRNGIEVDHRMGCLETDDFMDMKHYDYSDSDEEMNSPINIEKQKKDGELLRHKGSSKHIRSEQQRQALRRQIEQLEAEQKRLQTETERKSFYPVLGEGRLNIGKMTDDQEKSHQKLSRKRQQEQEDQQIQTEVEKRRIKIEEDILTDRKLRLDDIEFNLSRRLERLEMEEKMRQEDLINKQRDLEKMIEMETFIKRENDVKEIEIRRREEELRRKEMRIRELDRKEKDFERQLTEMNKHRAGEKRQIEDRLDKEEMIRNLKHRELELLKLEEAELKEKMINLEKSIQDTSVAQPDEVDIEKHKETRFPRLPKLLEESFEEWKTEVEVMLDSGIYSKDALLHAVRNSICNASGNIRRVLPTISKSATTHDILRKLDSIYGDRRSSESHLAEFYKARQLPKESVAEWGIRLENIIKKVEQKGNIDEEQKDEMLRKRFWKYLYSETLKINTRIIYDKCHSFDDLFKEVRIEERELEADSDAVDFHQTPKQEDRLLKQLIDKVGKLEEEVKRNKTNRRKESVDREERICEYDDYYWDEYDVTLRAGSNGNDEFDGNCREKAERGRTKTRWQNNRNGNERMRRNTSYETNRNERGYYDNRRNNNYGRGRERYNRGHQSPYYPEERFNTNYQGNRNDGAFEKSHNSNWRYQNQNDSYRPRPTVGYDNRWQRQDGRHREGDNQGGYHGYKFQQKGGQQTNERHENDRNEVRNDNQGSQHDRMAGDLNK